MESECSTDSPTEALSVGPGAAWPVLPGATPGLPADARPLGGAEIDPAPVTHEEVHAPDQLRILAMLAAAQSLDETTLRDHLGIPEWVLSGHLTSLQGRGYISILAVGSGRGVRTTVSITKAGRKAYAAYIPVLKRIASAQVDYR